MAHTLTVLTLWLAEAIGLYAIAAGALLLGQPRRFAAIVDGMERNAAVTWLCGFAAYALGVAILIPHHITYSWLAIVVTLVAVIACIEGLLLIVAPQIMFRLARMTAAAPRLWGGGALVIGLILFVAGFTGRADAIPQGV